LARRIYYKSEKEREGIDLGIILWPFRMIWSLIGLVFCLTGRLIGAILGFVLMIIGIILTVTVVAAVVGIPILVFGLLLAVRSLF